MLDWQSVFFSVAVAFAPIALVVGLAYHLVRGRFSMKEFFMLTGFCALVAWFLGTVYRALGS